MSDINVGDEFVDNDPRMRARRLMVVEVLPNGAVLIDTGGRRFAHLRRRLHTDGKPRRSGLSRVRAAVQPSGG